MTFESFYASMACQITMTVFVLVRIISRNRGKLIGGGESMHGSDEDNKLTSIGSLMLKQALVGLIIINLLKILSSL